MKQQQNLKAPSVKYCIVEGHQMEIVNHVCTNTFCGSQNRWICIKCILQKKHSKCEDHITDQEKFYNLLKERQQSHLKIIKEFKQQIMFLVEKFKIVFDDINLTLQELEKNFTKLQNLYNLKLLKIDDLIKKTEEDFSQLQNRQILEINQWLYVGVDFIYEFKQNMNRINQNTQKIIKDIDQIYNGGLIFKQRTVSQAPDLAQEAALNEGKKIIEQDQQKQKQVQKKGLFGFIQNREQ